jgi:hypothetical protein
VEKVSSEFDTQIGYDLINKIPVPIGNKDMWIDTGKRDKGRVVWAPKNEQSKKADPGRSHWCCYRACIPLIVNQGSVNSWSFSRKKTSKLSHCNVQENINNFSQLKRTNEGYKHNYAKILLTDYLKHEDTKKRLNIHLVEPEERFSHPDLVIIPDITITHNDGKFTFVEIVDYSSPHKNSNAWKFYENQQENLVVIDIKHNQEGWHFNTEKIQMILIEKFERHFADRTNYAKLWDEVDRVLASINQLNIVNNFSQPWTGLDSFKISYQNWKNYCVTLADVHQKAFEGLVETQSSIEWINDEMLELIDTLEENDRDFRPLLPMGKTFRFSYLVRVMADQVGSFKAKYGHMIEQYSFDDGVPIHLMSCRFMIFDDELIFTDAHYDYNPQIKKNWKTLDNIQHKKWITENWNERLEKQAKIELELMREQKTELYEKISLLQNFNRKKNSTPAEMAKVHSLLQQGSIEHFQNMLVSIIAHLELDLPTFARLQKVNLEDWKFKPTDLSKHLDR